jgi:hypothetical protein
MEKTWILQDRLVLADHVSCFLHSMTFVYPNN